MAPSSATRWPPEEAPTAATRRVSTPKRAERLLDNLALPESADVAEWHEVTLGGQDRLKATILALVGMVERFVHNPIFREVNVIDAKSSARARRDPEEIVELSGRLKKDCERLTKNSR